MNAVTEEHRLEASKTKGDSRLRGPYLNERQWGTVREDYGVPSRPEIISLATRPFPSGAVFRHLPPLRSERLEHE